MCPVILMCENCILVHVTSLSRCRPWPFHSPAREMPLVRLNKCSTRALPLIVALVWRCNFKYTDNGSDHKKIVRPGTLQEGLEFYEDSDPAGLCLVELTVRHCMKHVIVNLQLYFIADCSQRASLPAHIYIYICIYIYVRWWMYETRFAVCDFELVSSRTFIAELNHHWFM